MVWSGKVRIPLTLQQRSVTEAAAMRLKTGIALQDRKHEVRIHNAIRTFSQTLAELDRLVDMGIRKLGLGSCVVARVVWCGLGGTIID